MDIFFILFFIGISLYFLGSISSLFFYLNKKSDIVSLILSLLASVIMSVSAFEFIYYINNVNGKSETVTTIESLELGIFGDLFKPLEMSFKVDMFSAILLLVISLSSIVISIYIYTSSLKGEIKVSYNKSSFLANLFMIILSFIILANQGYFLTLLISCAVVLIFTMLASDFKNREAAKGATHYLILGNIAVILIIIAYVLSNRLTVNGFEAGLIPYDKRNVVFMMIMTGVIILLSVIPTTNYSHVRLLINGLFSKIILFILFRFVVNLFSGNISMVCILILLAAGLVSVFYNSYKASLTIEGFKWLKHADIALNALCFTSIIFSLYADNLGAGLIAEQIRISTYIMILCSIVLYPAVTVIIHSYNKIDKSKRFKLIALCIFIPKALLPPIGGFAGIFMIMSNVSALLDLNYMLKTLLLIASVFGLIYVYLFYIYAHMKFFINVIDAGYEPKSVEAKRKISRGNIAIICFSIIFTFITGFGLTDIISEVGSGMGVVYSGETLTVIAKLVINVGTMFMLVYFLNSTQVSNTLRAFYPSEIKKAAADEGIYHVYLKLASFIFLLVGGTFYSISGNLILEGVKSFAILGVMYIIMSSFLLYDKDIDFKDLYIELFMMCVIMIDSVSPQELLIKIFMGSLYIVFLAYAIYRQKVKIRDNYDRLLYNGKIYLYIAFFITFFIEFTLPLEKPWNYVLYLFIGIIMFIVIFIVSSLISINVFSKKSYKKLLK